MLNEKDGQIEIKQSGTNNYGLDSIDTTSISRIYSEPLIILSRK